MRKFHGRWLDTASWLAKLMSLQKQACFSDIALPEAWFLAAPARWGGGTNGQQGQRHEDWLLATDNSPNS
jgi:hypothetical protein